MVYLLDTNHCSRIIHGDTTIAGRVKTLSDPELTTSVTVRGELVYMMEKSQQRVLNLQRVQLFFRDIRVLPVDDETADIYGAFKAEIVRHFGPRERSKQRRARIEQLGVGENDLWIACVALQHGLTVVSSDSDFARMREVRAFALESWL